MFFDIIYGVCIITVVKYKIMQDKAEMNTKWLAHLVYY